MSFYWRTATQFLLLTIIMLFPCSILRGENSICLTMIVKNEEKIIERCLNSVKNVVDCISICDTGSSDNTIQIIEQYMKKNNIPGKVHRHEWKNFGHNRTLSVQTAQKTLEELGFSLNNTFLLLLDADMLLEVGFEFDKNALQDDSYLVCQKSDYHSYYNTRLVRASLPWKCLGVTHEYWSCLNPCGESKLNTISIDDRDDGGCKVDKFERDVKLLTQGLQDEPENERYMFYLAQSYKSLKNYDESIKWYEDRIKKGGWFEEIWYSKFMIGQCLEEKGLWNQALLSYLDAFQFNPGRAEPLHQISKYYRSNNQNHLAYLFAKHGSCIPYPDEQILFISHPVYDYLFDEELSISAYYTSFKEEGYAAANRLLLNKNVPYHTKEQAHKNMLFYVQNLKNAKYQPIIIDLPLIREGLLARFNPLNPSIRKTETGYDVICRTVNYMQIGAKHFTSLDLLDTTNTYKTRNIFVQYDQDFNVLSQKEIIEELPRERKQFRNVVGLEDCRLFAFKNSTWFSCTTLDTNPTGQPQVSVCKLSDNRAGPIIYVEELFPLFGPNPNRCEKNWLPFLKDNEIHLIYSFDPFIIYRPSLEKDPLRNFQIMSHYDEPKYDFSRFSGSAPPIEFDNGYLVLVHETVYNDQRNYMHRFIFLDKDLNFKKLSKPFTFLHHGIEYCCGMAIDHSTTKLIMTIGIEDREAYLCIVDLDTVRSMLEPLSD